MILVDANQIAISHLMIRHKVENDINITTIRKSIIRVLARISKKFKGQYGEMVLCYDDKDSWRKQAFEYYKKNRKQEREKSKYDWDVIFSVLNKIRDEIRSNFPWKVLQSPGTEADDIIAVLCYHNSHKVEPEPILILSADKDFIQLHKFKDVKQYDPIHNRWIVVENPVQYLQEHIVKGDRSDGIPNILTCDDAIYRGVAQKRMSKEKIREIGLMSPEDFTNFIRLRNWKRNAELIDFAFIPQPIRDRILSLYYKTIAPKSINMCYFTEHQLSDILSEF